MARVPRNGRSETGDPATPGRLGDTATEHSNLTMEDCDGAPAHRSPTMVSLEREVQVVAPPQKPLRLNGATPPAESELFVEREVGDTSEPGWDYVDTQVGTLAEPFAINCPTPSACSWMAGPAPTTSGRAR